MLEASLKPVASTCLVAAGLLAICWLMAVLMPETSALDSSSLVAPAGWVIETSELSWGCVWVRISSTLRLLVMSAQLVTTCTSTPGTALVTIPSRVAETAAVSTSEQARPEDSV